MPLGGGSKHSLLDMDETQSQPEHRSQKDQSSFVLPPIPQKSSQVSSNYQSRATLKRNSAQLKS